MKANYEQKSQLAKGQIWRTGAATIEIVKLGKRLIQYRVTRQSGLLRQVSAQISGIAPMENYLKVKEARLVKMASAN